VRRSGRMRIWRLERSPMSRHRATIFRWPRARTAMSWSPAASGLRRSFRWSDSLRGSRRNSSFISARLRPAPHPLLPELRALCGDRLQTWFSDEGRRFGAEMIGPPDDGRHLYVCGPPRLLTPVLAHAAATGWPETQVHTEIFKPHSDENFKPEPFDAFIASTGTVLHVPADRSLLDVLRAHGLATASSCELGVCGSCVCGYRNGTVIHRDVVLPLASRQDRMMPCVSRAHVSVTLDL
jgi:ferredoxin